MRTFSGAIAVGIGLAGVSLTSTVGPLVTVGILGGAAAVYALVRWSQLRLAWFVLGALLVFQSSDAVTGQKLAYLAGAVLVAGLSLVRVLKSRDTWLAHYRPVLWCTCAYSLVLVISLAVGVDGNGLSGWLRDVSPYVLLALAPIVAFDAAHDMSTSSVEGLVLVAGVGGAVGFTSDWLDRRGVSALPFGRLLLASVMLAAAGFAFTLARAALGPHQTRWAAAAAGIPMMMLTTGTRTIVAFAIGLLGLIGRRSRQGLSAWKVTLLGGGLAGLLAIGVPVAASRVLSDPAFLDARIRAALSLAQNRGDGDASFQGRSSAYQTVLAGILEHPWFGAGPGNIRLQVALDTPLITVLKFGVVGSVVLVALLVSMVMCGRRSAQVHGYTTTHTAARVFTYLAVGLLPFGAPLEDKGFPAAVCLVLCAVAITTRVGSAGVDTQGGAVPEADLADGGGDVAAGREGHLQARGHAGRP